MQIFFVSLLKVTVLLLSIVHSLLLSIHTTVQNTSACFIIVECGLVIVAISIKNIFSSVRVGLIAAPAALVKLGDYYYSGYYVLKNYDYAKKLYDMAR